MSASDFEIFPAGANGSLKFSQKYLKAIFGDVSHYLVEQKDNKIIFYPLTPQALQNLEENKNMQESEKIDSLQE